MRKIIVGAQVSIDGVMQAPGAPTEDKEFGEEIDHVFEGEFDLMLGRIRPHAGPQDLRDLRRLLAPLQRRRFAWRHRHAVQPGQAHSFTLTRSRVAPNGLIIGHYERRGEIEIGDAALHSSSDREVARQHRMKREGSRVRSRASR